MITSSPATDATPRAYVACLACYLNGRLTGDWFDADLAEAVVPATIHGIHARTDGHEELWVLDHENLPVVGECSPQEAARVARAVLAVGPEQREAFVAWIESGDYVKDGDGSPSASNFEERFEGPSGPRKGCISAGQCACDGSVWVA